MRKLLAIILGVSVLLTSCAPVAQYFNVDVKDQKALELPLKGRPIAVLSLYGTLGKEYDDINKLDSINNSNVAIGVAEKLEEDCNLLRGDVNVYSLHANDYHIYEKHMVSYDGNTKEDYKLSGEGGRKNSDDPVVDFPDMDAFDNGFIQDLMVKTGAHVFVKVSHAKYGNPQIRKAGVMEAYDNVNVVIPYSASVLVFDGIKNRKLYGNFVKDSVYMQVAPSVVEEDRVYSTLLTYMSEISRKVGIKLGSMLTPQWETQERMLISYDGDTKWESAYLLARDFKWDEAIEIWMELAQSKNPRKAACAAYNIAVGCEMMEQFSLAEKWIELSIEKNSFQESVDLQEHLKSLKTNTK